MSLFFALPAVCRLPLHYRRLTWPPSTLLVFDYPSPPRVPVKLPSPRLLLTHGARVDCSANDTFLAPSYTTPERMRAGRRFAEALTS